MKITEFFKDRIFLYISYIVTYGIILIFMQAFHTEDQLKWITGVIFLLMVITIESWEFFRKRSFYNSLKSKLENLDQKFLISEMIEVPSFAEGKLFCEVIRETAKSMCENVAVYRNNSAEFREFIELWVHEIKLPVSSLQLMAHNNKSELNEKFLEQLMRIDSYIDTVLYYARSENAEKDYLIKETSLKRTVSNIALKHRETLLIHNVSIRTSGLDINVLTDGKWLEFILEQLMANSIKFFSSEREPEITISAEELPDKMILHYKDNGIGIPGSDIPYIFNKSFTGENGRNGTKSTGMGLYIVKNLCGRLGHSIRVVSERNKFTEFEIIFQKNDFYKFS